MNMHFHKACLRQNSQSDLLFNAYFAFFIVLVLEEIWLHDKINDYMKEHRTFGIKENRVQIYLYHISW